MSRPNDARRKRTTRKERHVVGEGDVTSLTSPRLQREGQINSTGVSLPIQPNSKASNQTPRVVDSMAERLSKGPILLDQFVDLPRIFRIDECEDLPRLHVQLQQHLDRLIGGFELSQQGRCRRHRSQGY